MSLGDFRSVFMPYCLQKQVDGRYVVLNREYKPVGFYTKDFIKYEDHPVAVYLKGIGPDTAAKLSWDSDTNTDKIFLYNDDCIPTHNAKNMKAYLAKIEILAKLRIKEQ